MCCTPPVRRGTRLCSSPRRTRPPRSWCSTAGRCPTSSSPASPWSPKAAWEPTASSARAPSWPNARPGSRPRLTRSEKPMILADIGAGALLAGLVLAAFSTLLSFWAGRQENPVLVQVGRRAFYAAAAMVLVAAVVLEVALLTHDFSLAYVVEHTDLSTPTPLVAAGFYGGQGGALLYWTLILGALGGASLLASARIGARGAAYAAGIPALVLHLFLFRL